MIGVSLGGRATSRIGFGCARLMAGAGLKESAQLLDVALSLGIRHFDTAPMYGFGGSEDVLGQVLGGNPDVTVVTKVGQPRPGNTGLKTLGRQVLGPLLAHVPALKARAVQRVSGGRLPACFGEQDMRASVEDSLRRLRRDAVDGLLLHEIKLAQMTPNVAATLAGFTGTGQASAVGSGTGAPLAELVRCGTIAQYRWQPGLPAPMRGETHVIHGLLRFWLHPPARFPAQIEAIRALGRDPADAAGWLGLLLTFALCSRPETVVLVSTKSPARLRATLAGIDWALVADGTPGTVDLLAQAVGIALSGPRTER